MAPAPARPPPATSAEPLGYPKPLSGPDLTDPVPLQDHLAAEKCIAPAVVEGIARVQGVQKMRKQAAGWAPA